MRNSETGGLSGARPPQRQPTACADTVRAAQESSVTAETACAQVNVHKDGVRVCTHTHTHAYRNVQTSAVNLVKVHLGVTSVVGF